MTTKTKIPTSKYILDTSREYSIYVCSSRAIPSVTDGLKDSQRKALWVIKNEPSKIKTVSLAGSMIASGLYMHGDKSAADAISMLAAPFVNNVPLLEGIGAFGTRVAPVDGIGAPRYTYVKRGNTANALIFRDLDIVPMMDNYDGSAQEPRHFLPLIPLVLLNGISGIAVGWSTSILPRSMKKLVTATQQALRGEKITGLDPAFDYLNVEVKKLDEAWEFHGRCDILDTSTVKITELPPSLNLQAMKKRLNKMEEDGLIQTYTDRSTGVIDITVKFKRGEVKDWTPETAVQFFKLKEKSSERLVVIDWNGTSIRQYDSAEDIVRSFADWRLAWYKDRYQKMLDDDSYELKYWQGVKACFDDKLPERLGKKVDKADVEQEVSTITVKIGLDASQIDKIVSLPTYRWAQDFLQTVKNNIALLQGQIKSHKSIIKDPQAMKDIYLAELDELKKLK